ncbi:response regulator [Fodinibius halophilus]|uniref:Response regulator n=1 Tax=Fodinibius halophilus TaxID=1736908 RepID=A0A6M1T7D8_9BACT|nr:response regulator [Fodinibius halophilus]NGP87901.1 response regulator [Fodinibius halophilus]
MDYQILVIDDDKPMHIFIDKVLSDDYKVIHVYDAQEGIDILSKEPINLVIADIYMPGLNGLDFVQVLKKDSLKKQIPVLVMSNLPTEEKKKKALDYGAAEVINKSEVINNHDELLETIKLQLITNVVVPEVGDLVQRKNRLIKKIMSDARNSDFQTLVKDLCRDIFEQFNLDYIAFCEITGDGVPQLICDLYNYSPNGYDFSKDLLNEETFIRLQSEGEAYLSNNVFGEGEGIMQEYSKKYDLSSEITVPLFAADEKRLLMNKMKVPEDAEMFGLFVLKRNKLFTTEEYQMVSRLLVQTGSVLWRMHSKS